MERREDMERREGRLGGREGEKRNWGYFGNVARLENRSWGERVGTKGGNQGWEPRVGTKCCRKYFQALEKRKTITDHETDGQTLLTPS